MRAPAPIRLACAGLVAGAALALVVGAAHASEGRPPVRVVICGSHDRVLAHWLQAVEDGILPASGLQVVHVDAHPDLAVPKQPLPGLADCLDANLAAARLVSKDVRCAGVSVNTAGLDAAAAQRCLDATEDALAMVCVDPVRTGVSRLVDRLSV